jgi:hypothetical protein
MSTVDFGGKLDDLRERRRAYETTIAKCGDVLPQRDELDATVRRRFAREALWRASRAYDRGRTATTPVDELVEFARECWPEYRRLPEYRGLRVRQAIGPAAMPYLQPLVVSAVVAKARNWYWWRHWKRYGV